MQLYIKFLLFIYCHRFDNDNSKLVKPLVKVLFLSNLIDFLVTLYNTGALICINSCLTNAQIIMS